MAQALETGNDLVIPHAAHLSGKFLNVIQQHCDDEDFGLTLAPRQVKGRVFLIGKIQFGNVWMRSKERHLVVFADAAGNSLHVGWQLTAEDQTFAHMMSGTLRSAAHMNDIIDARPDFQRQITTVLLTFNDLVFEPVVDLLVDAVERH